MDPESLLVAAGPLREAYAGVNWAATPLGDPEQWSPELDGAVRLLLATEFPATLLWGPDFALVYNHAYTDLIGDKHPEALGSPARVVFPEAWDQIGPIMRSALNEGHTTSLHDALVPLKRRGFLEECYFTFCYSPIAGPDGTPQGVLDIVTETTPQVVAQRRLQLLASLSDTFAVAETDDDLADRAFEVLRRFPTDLPTVAIRSSAHRPGLDTGTPSSSYLIEQLDGSALVWLPMPTAHGAKDPAYLVVELNQQIAPDETYLGFLQLVASALAQRFARLELLAAERLVARTEREISESLQLSFLSETLTVPGLQIATRYTPATSIAKIGGDWYDTFHGPDGALHIVLGDVAGHDQQAAVSMAQARNLMRGIAYTLNSSPARTMEAFDRAITGLDTRTLLTAVLARIEQPVRPDEEGPSASKHDERDLDSGVHLTLSSAGHLPAIIVSPDGTTRLLDDGDPLLGVEPDVPRTEQHLHLTPGSVLVLYTDGLVERRGEVLDDGIERLRLLIADHADLDAHELADRALLNLTDHDDDVALLVLRVTGTEETPATTSHRAVPTDD